MTTLYLLLMLNGKIVEYPTVSYNKAISCIKQAEENIKANPNTLWVCKAQP